MPLRQASSPRWWRAGKEGVPPPGQLFAEPPESIDAELCSIFYLHGAIVDSGERRPVHPEYGPYEYDENVRALRAPGVAGAVITFRVSTILARSPSLDGLREIRLSTGLGHGFLCRPLPGWIDPVREMVRQGCPPFP